MGWGDGAGNVDVRHNYCGKGRVVGRARRAGQTGEQVDKWTMDGAESQVNNKRWAIS